MTTVAMRRSRTRARRLTLLVDGASGEGVAAFLRAFGFSVEAINSLGGLMRRPYAPRPDAVVLVNNPSDATVCAVHNLVQRRWRGTMVIVGGDAHDRHALTARECDILRLLPVEGTNRAIGERLGLEPASVQSVICDLMSKRDRRRAGLISYAYALGLVTQTAVEVMERDD